MGYNYKIEFNLKSPKMAVWSLSVLTLLSSILIGHFLAPIGIINIPIVISMFASFVFLINTNLTLFRKSVICYLFIGLNAHWYKAMGRWYT
jgi:NAD/NADP transhydrogenase beta subunit